MCHETLLLMGNNTQMSTVEKKKVMYHKIMKLSKVRIRIRLSKSQLKFNI